jgi:hypothetical protein
MTGIDMSMYAQDTPCETMACMVQMGAVDLDNPEASELLTAIGMGDPESSVFDVSAEHKAMLEWITWSAQCHGSVCGDIESACDTGTGAASTGLNPIGDCSEADLLVQFWDSVIIDRNRCVDCHSTAGVEKATMGPCTSDSDCDAEKGFTCLDGYCRKLGPYVAPNFLEGSLDTFDWNNAQHQQLALNTMYNIVAMGLVDDMEVLNSPLVVKPLVEGFQPLAVYGPGVNIPSVADGVGAGAYHGGSHKFKFGFKNLANIPDTAVIDCRIDKSCTVNADCDPGEKCAAEKTVDGKVCRLKGSVCEMTYVNYVRFFTYFNQCK